MKTLLPSNNYVRYGLVVLASVAILATVVLYGDPATILALMRRSG